MSYGIVPGKITKAFDTPYGQIQMQPESTAHLGDVAVLGLGKSGTGVARYCLSLMSADSPRVSSVTIYPGGATSSAKALIDELASLGARIVPDAQVVSGEYDIALVSPGIPQPSEFYQSALAAAGEVITEPELAYRESPWGWVGVTGTNGKTTTTSLISHVLNNCDIEAKPVGNIGSACIDAIAARKPGQVLVAELSSFQLASMPSFCPVVGILLNITPDHIEWHGSLEAYAQAKCNMFSNLDREESLCVIDADDPGSAPLVFGLRREGFDVVALTQEQGPGSASCVDGMLGYSLPYAQDGEWTWLGEESGLQIKGAHNTKNALAAACACAHFGIPAQKLYEALCSFRPIEHRIEPVGYVDGVYYCNDSKATNTDATVKALTAFGEKPLIVLLGGHDKMTDLSQMVEACARRCKAIVCYGEAKERFAKAFAECEAARGLEVVTAPHMPQALEAARSMAVDGDAVVLSPACSSYDEFTCFEERGDAFKRLVLDMPGRHS